MEKHEGEEEIKRFELEKVTLNVLNIERTFVDKLMSVKRHAICGTLEHKVRHIYDVTKLYEMPQIKAFLDDKDELKRLIRETKETDSYYLNKRHITKEYDPRGFYDFEKWENHFTEEIKKSYGNLHKELLYTDIQQNFADAVHTFKEVSHILKEMEE